MIEKEYLMQRKMPIVLVILILITGSVLYFTQSKEGEETAEKANVLEKIEAPMLKLFKNVQLKAANTAKSTVPMLDLFKNVQLKTAMTDEGTIDIFALAKNNDLSKLSASQGEPIPEIRGMVLGNIEGIAMQEEGEFKSIGDNVNDYDISFRIDGVLAKTGTFADYFHFISSEQFNQLNAETESVVIKFKDEKTPKLFYLYDKNNPIKIELAEGNMNLFFIPIRIDNKSYYPMIIGSKEAKIMREGKVFSRIGDTIENFIGKGVIVVGVVKETNTGLDMMYIAEKDFFNASTEQAAISDNEKNIAAGNKTIEDNQNTGTAVNNQAAEVVIINQTAETSIKANNQTTQAAVNNQTIGTVTSNQTTQKTNQTI